MPSSPRRASAFVRCRLWIPISADRHSTMRSRAVLLGGVTLLCAGGIFACLVLASGHKSALRDLGSDSPPRNGDEYLARVADCVACHSIPGGKGFAGGLKMGTPLGAFYSTNITPDPETGIGSYSLADFDLAVRHGIARDGHRLYPAMPYPSYVKLADADVVSLYRFFMKHVPPVHQANLRSEIPTLFSFRWPLAFWNFFFAPSVSYVAKPNHDAVWNRGAYLVQGPGHCGACHTPRGIGLQEKALDDSSANFLAGAELDAWYAPSLCGDMRTGLGTWSTKDIGEFLKHGHHRVGSAFGSMTDVINNSTSYFSDNDIDAIAVYLKSLPASSAQQPVAYDNATTDALRNSPTTQPGAAIYASDCASCHGFDAKGFTAYMPALAGNPVVLDENASSLINVLLNGSVPLVAKGTHEAYRMPSCMARPDSRPRAGDRSEALSAAARAGA